MKLLYARDLTELPGTDPLWRPGPRAEPEGTISRPDLPNDGFASPLGFWFAAAESWNGAVAPLRVEVFDTAELAGGSSAGGTAWRGVATALHRRSAQLDLAKGRARVAEAPSRLTVEIDADAARIRVDGGEWQSVSETVLIVVAQFWRFLAIERALDELTDWARSDLKSAGSGRVIRLRRSRELRACQRSLQALLLDLPDFEGAFLNPRACLAPGVSMRLYRTLAVQLGLDRWRRKIDLRVEVVEAVLDSLVESLNHSSALYCQIVLELVIVAVLLLDVGLYLVTALAGR